MKKKKKLKKKLLSYALTLCFTLLIIGLLYFGYTLFFKEKEKELSFLETVETSTYLAINKYVIYGIHMNFEGSFTLPETVSEMKLILTNGETEIEIPTEITKTESNSYTFQTSKSINDGLVLDNLPQGNFYLILKTTNYNEENEETHKYYSVTNKTTYSDLEYYTLTTNQKNNKIAIEWNTYAEIPTLRFKITEEKLPDEVYDITIDPGHGGSDPGKTACSDGSEPNYLGYCQSGNLVKESTLNLDVALKLKEELETLGYKAALTREEDKKVGIYDKFGSATMANDTKSKFNIAIHHNSSGFGTVKGLEVYIANDTKLDLAHKFVEEITANANTTSSTMALHKVDDGIYQRFFTPEEIANDDVQPSNKTTSTIYYYYIREVGGISTNATNDGRYSPTYPKNEHYNSNNTAESYLFELGYMDNFQNLQNIINNPNGYAKGIANGLKDYLTEIKNI